MPTTVTGSSGLVHCVPLLVGSNVHEHPKPKLKPSLAVAGCKVVAEVRSTRTPPVSLALCRVA